MENDEIGKALVTLVGAVRHAWEAAAPINTSEPYERLAHVYTMLKVMRRETDNADLDPILQYIREGKT